MTAKEILESKLKQPQYSAYIGNEKAINHLYNDIVHSLEVQRIIRLYNEVVLEK